MARFKLTSPGVLLILAILAAAGIFLLDAFFLRPHIDSQRDSALQEEAVKTNVIKLLGGTDSQGPDPVVYSGLNPGDDVRSFQIKAVLFGSPGEFYDSIVGIEDVEVSVVVDIQPDRAPAHLEPLDEGIGTDGLRDVCVAAVRQPLHQHVAGDRGEVEVRRAVAVEVASIDTHPEVNQPGAALR